MLDRTVEIHRKTSFPFEIANPHSPPGCREIICPTIPELEKYHASQPASKRITLAAGKTTGEVACSLYWDKKGDKPASQRRQEQDGKRSGREEGSANAHPEQKFRILKPSALNQALLIITALIVRFCLIGKKLDRFSQTLFHHDHGPITENAAS
jgi:hypothetical protein